MSSDATYLGAGTDSNLGRVPDKGASAGKIKAFFDNFADFTSIYHREIFADFYEQKAFVESHHWLQRQMWGNQQTGIRWTNQLHESIDEIPKPVTNEILPIFDSEVGRLRNRRSKPRIQGSPGYSHDEWATGGAKRADDILESHLKQLRWERVRRTFIRHHVQFGTGILKSYLESDFMDTVMVGRSGCFRCPQGHIFGSDKLGAEQFLGLPPDQAGRLQQTLGTDSRGNPTASYSMTSCVVCGGNLGDYTPTPEEAQNPDQFGTPLGKKAPLNRPMIDAVSPFEMFFENEGIAILPWECREWLQVTPRSLDWIAQHYNLTVRNGRYFKGDQEVRAEDPYIIAENHPIIGEFSYGSMGSRSVDTRHLFKNHARVREFYSLPSPRHPNGRCIVMVGNIVLLDDDYLIPSKAINPETGQPSRNMIPRVIYRIARFYEKEGEIRGQSMIAPLISPQKRVNMRWSQIISNAERMGNAGILAQRGTNLESPGLLRGYPGNVLWYDDPNGDGSGKPSVWEGKLMDPQAFQEVDATVARMQAIAGQQDPDQGKAPRNVSSATGIKLLQDASSERRQQRIEEMTDAMKDIWQHQLVLLREFVREPRSYSFQNPSTGSWEEASFLGTDIPANTEIMVEEEASYDEVAYEREAVAQGLQLGILQATTPYARYQAAKAMGLPASIAEEQDVQIQDALSKWYDFKRFGKIPAIDQFNDAHDVFFSVYGKELKSDWGKGQAKQNGQDVFLQMIAGWEDALKQRQALEPQIQAMKQAIATGQQVPMVAGIEQALQEPPLPKYLPDAIMYTWRKMQQTDAQQAAASMGPMLAGASAMSTSGMAPLVQPTVDLSRPWFTFQAVVQAHRLYNEATQVEQMQGQPQTEAPGQEAEQPPQGAAPVAQ